MANQNQTNSTSSRQSARFGVLALCIVTCSLTGCVANWSVLGERIPGGSHPADAVCPTCAAPQTAVVPPAATPPANTSAAAGSQPPAVPPAPVVAQTPLTPVVTAETKLAECEERVWRLEDDLRKRDEERRRSEAEQEDRMNSLLAQLKNMEQEQKERTKKDLDQIRALNEMLRREFENAGVDAQTVAPSPLQTPPAPESSQAVNELKALPPATGSL